MQAVRYHGPHQPLRLEDVPRPEPGPGEVLVRVRAAGRCHTELHFLSGLLDLGAAPLTLGHEVVGVVAATGPGVDAARVGEHVILYYYVGCGRCAHCLRGDENLCPAPRAEYGFLSDGGFAAYVAVPARNAVPLPAHLSDEEAAPIGCGVTTAIHATRLAHVGAGDTVLVYGVGTVGYGLIQVSTLAGAAVIAVGRSGRKLALAKELGAHAVVNAAHEDVAARVRDLTEGRGVDVVFELVATQETMAHTMPSVAKRGRLVFVGYSEDALNVHPITLVVNEVQVMGSVGNTLGELYEAVRWVGEGRIRTVVDRCLRLDQFQDGLDALAAGDLRGRAVLLPDGG